MNMEEKDFLILFEVFNDYVEKNHIEKYVWSHKALRTTFLMNAYQTISIELSKTDIDKTSDYYLNSNKYIEELFYSRLGTEQLIKVQEMQKRERNEAIQKEDEIFKKKMASLNK